ncbi:hypothetical protein A2U01_0073080, partial [Trifolium medium]|nr:hypothetical protein [Trifolium medium]
MDASNGGSGGSGDKKDNSHKSKIVTSRVMFLVISTNKSIMLEVFVLDRKSICRMGLLSSTCDYCLSNLWNHWIL